MFKKCISCIKTENGYFCTLCGKAIDYTHYKKFCRRMRACPRYRHCLSEYKRLVGIIKKNRH